MKRVRKIKSQKIFTNVWKLKKAFYLCTPLQRALRNAIRKVKATFTKNNTELNLAVLEALRKREFERTVKDIVSFGGQKA